MKKKSIFLGLVFILLFSTAFPQNENKNIAIKGGKILTISGEDIEDGIILIKNGKISEVGKNIRIPENAEVIDAAGKWILPGLIESHTTLGARSRYSGSNSDETSNPNTAQMLMIDGINPFDKNIKYAQRAGITSMLASPGRQNVIGGQPAVLKLRGNTVTEMILLSPAGIKISLGEGPKDAYGKKGRLPTTRMGSAYVLRKALIEAEDYTRKWEEYEKKRKKDKNTQPPKRDLKLEPLAEVRKGKLTAFIECYRADDIMTALRLIDEFKLKAVLVGCTEGHKIPEEIAKRKVPVIVSPFGVGPRRMETQDIKLENAAILAKAGVKVVIKSDEALGMGTLQELPLHAALAVKGGLDNRTALRAITLSAAEVLGVNERIGSIEKGKDADLVIFDGDPLYYITHVDRVLIEGKTVFKSR
jgi:imidazolonepropionase-like amidohydrolase